MSTAPDNSKNLAAAVKSRGFFSVESGAGAAKYFAAFFKKSVGAFPVIYLVNNASFPL